MSVSLNVGRGYYYNFDETRLKKIVSAQSLDEASSMSTLELVIDWFRCGVKRKAIEKLFRQVCVPEPHEREPAQVTRRFTRLRDLAKNEYQPQFSINIYNHDQAGRTFTLTIGNHQIYSGKLHYDADLYACCAVKTCMNLESLFYDYRDFLTRDFHTKEDFIDANIECMSDEKETREFLLHNLDDPCYAKENFIGIKVHPDDDNKFIAQFKEDNNIIFSNRPSTMGELRGELLQEILKSMPFENLREVCNYGFMTEKDRFLLYITAPIKSDLKELIKQNGHLKHEDVHGVLCQEEILRALYNQKIGNTNLGRLFNLPEPLPNPLLLKSQIRMTIC